MRRWYRMYPSPIRSAYSSIQCQRRARLVLKLTDEASISRPALVLVEQHDEQRRGIPRRSSRRVAASSPSVARTRDARPRGFWPFTMFMNIPHGA